MRPHFVKARVRVHVYPDGSHAVFHGPRCIGRYDENRTIKDAKNAALTPLGDAPRGRHGQASGLQKRTYEVLPKPDNFIRYRQRRNRAEGQRELTLGYCRRRLRSGGESRRNKVSRYVWQGVAPAIHLICARIRWPTPPKTKSGRSRRRESHSAARQVEKSTITGSARRWGQFNALYENTTM
jgi:hypothetical protein